MLNFENEMKATNTSYVVLSLEEYHRLRDEARAAADFMDKLVSVDHRSWSNTWDVGLDRVLVYEAAKKKLERALGDKMSEYDVKELKDFAYYSAAIATPKPATAADFGDDDADDILNSDD